MWQDVHNTTAYTAREFDSVCLNGADTQIGMLPNWNEAFHWLFV